MSASPSKKLVTAAGSKLKAMVVLGSVRKGGAPRLGDRVTKYITSKIDSKFDIDLVDLIEHTNYATVEMPHYWRKPEQQDPAHVAMAQRIAKADAFVLVFPEYNHSLPPALTGFLDHFNTFAYKPVALCCYSAGPFGGVRAAIQARAMTAELGMFSVSALFAAPSAYAGLSPEGVPTSPELAKLFQQSFDKTFNQLEWIAQATKNQREAVGLPQ